MNAQRKMLIKIWSGVAAVFLLGCITGAAVNGLYLSGADHDTTTLAPHDANEYFQTLKREVNLTPQQQESMSAILDEMRTEYKSVCAEVRPRYYNVRESARLKMRKLLTPEQQKRFDAIVTKDDCSCPETPK
ncbi:MAG: hypothetical protein HY231_04645 [Acidobacteria bacterium]|nr:hypothetical protein [Acidobacteriota bacterium]